MRSVLALASIASLASLAAAQGGYGRFPCTIINGDKTFSADQTQCDGTLIAPGTGTGVAGQDAQSDTPPPVGAICSMETETGAYFCGIAGAACSTNDQCDNGLCRDGKCQGGFGQSCSNSDANCSGLLSCQTPDFQQTASDTCGGLGAFCQDYTQGDASLTEAQNYAVFNQFCASGYCSYGLGACAEHVAVGGDCSTDPDFACVEGATCNLATLKCDANPTPSGARARARRAVHNKRNLCPASHSACEIPGAKGFECIDTQSNLEQCGACATQGGVDCTAIEGAEAVGCVAGQCEIWSCATGYSWDASKQACVA
ncbi:hypothetical protein JCM10207_000075 [Rhodosporidiobolus poonsookiae]